MLVGGGFLLRLERGQDVDDVAGRRRVDEEDLGMRAERGTAVSIPRLLAEDQARGMIARPPQAAR